MPPAPFVCSAPGRVNLIGEHTDYNGGFVLPTAIPQHTTAVLTRRSDRAVVAHSTNAAAEMRFVIGEEARRGDWLDYVQGLTWSLSQLGITLQSGFELQINSDVPLGAGVSSSAALEIAVLRAIRHAFDLSHLDDVRLAQLAQLAENEFVGARCGIMDQMAASLADTEHALFLDTRSLVYRRVPLPRDADLVVIHSGISHGIARGEYNTRRAECEEAARILGVAQLRDIASAELPRVEALPEPLRRRARHVVTEDERVLQAVHALDAGNTAALGELFAASHASMRDDFEVSDPDVDTLVEICQADAAIVGARMTGGGFGGSVVMFAVRGQGRASSERIARAYADRTARQPSVLVPQAR